MLYSIFSFAMQDYIMSHEVPPEYEGKSKGLFELYRTRTAQCLMAADMTRPVEYMIETLLIHSLVEYTEQRDGEMGVWMLSGTLMRMALQQGYHRDPSQHPNMSPFKAEMRRRIWLLVIQHELLFSVQLGLPKMVRYAETDTSPPRNLYEHDIAEDMKELPQSRVPDEPTEICYLITKSRIMRAYGQVVEYLHVVQEQPYEVVMKLDAQVRESRDLIPPHLVLDMNHKRPDDTAASIMETYMLQLFSQKSLCVLHRKYLTSYLSDDTYAYSRRTCIESALALLNNQASLHAECRDGGRLSRVKWHHFSLVNHDYLLGAMVVCLALYNSKQRRLSDGLSTIGFSNVSHHDEMLDTIQRARSIWAEVADQSPDAKRATNILTVILDKLGMTNPRPILKGKNLMPERSDQNISPVTERSSDSTFSVPVLSHTPESTIMNPPESSWGNTAYQAGFANPGPLQQTLYGGNEMIHDNLFSSGKIFNSFEPDMDIPVGVDWVRTVHSLLFICGKQLAIRDASTFLRLSPLFISIHTPISMLIPHTGGLGSLFQRRQSTRSPSEPRVVLQSARGSSSGTEQSPNGWRLVYGSVRDWLTLIEREFHS